MFPVPRGRCGGFLYPEGGVGVSCTQRVGVGVSCTLWCRRHTSDGTVQPGGQRSGGERTEEADGGSVSLGQV